jgi:phage virion morphogenesis protein
MSETKGEGLEPIADFLGTYLDHLSDGERFKVAAKIGRKLRRINGARIKKNITPDGAAMAPRKKKRRLVDRHGKKRLSGKMFPSLGMERYLKVAADEDGVEVGFGYNGFVNHLAQTHQQGLTVPIGRKGANTGGGSTKGDLIFARYPVRTLIAFTPQDIADVEEMVLDWLSNS